MFVVRGAALERFAQMSNWDYYEAVRRFQRVLVVAGVNQALKIRGVRAGDTVVLGAAEFEWSDAQNDAEMYTSWFDDMRARGKTIPGSSHWPRAL